MRAALDGLVLAIKLIMGSEGCCLRAYPDPASPLSEALVKRGLLQHLKDGRIVVPSDLRHLSGAPWTIGWGETAGVTMGMVWTQEEADTKLRARVGFFMLESMRKCPQLFLEPPERAAACTSLAYNIGLGAFGASSVCRKTKDQDFAGAARSFLLWNKAGGRVMRGLTLRRQAEAGLYSQPDHAPA
jgi:lysozyme